MAKKKLVLLRVGIWGICIGIILIIGVYYFPKEEPDLNFWGSLYYTIRLFILEHDLSEFPKSWPLIIIYFLAPLAALSAVGTLITYLFRFSPSVRMKFASNHVVICGVGRTGKLLAETIRKRGLTVIGVDSGASEDFQQWATEHKVRMIHGNFLSRHTLEKARVDRSHTLIFTSGDDLMNLEGAVGAYGWFPVDGPKIRLIWVHIATEKLADTARDSMRTKGNIGIRFFDTYRIAARLMLAKYFPKEISGKVSKVQILGFGKFGRDLFEILMTESAPEADWPVAVVDISDRSNEVCNLAKELKVARQVSYVQADIRQLQLVGENQAFFICTDDDIGNLAMALMITGKIEHGHVFVRMAQWPLPAIEEHLSENRGITFININELVKKGIENLPGIFKPAKLSDIKRNPGTKGNS